MAHKRKDTLVHTREWWKHLRPFGKRDQAGRERKAAKKQIEQELEERQEMENSLMLIKPYYDGTWMFDDPSRAIEREPFVSGMPEIIDAMTEHIPNARGGFTCIFSDQWFPSHTHTLGWIKEEGGGNWYYLQLPVTDDLTADTLTGWLCPALFKYFDQAPKSIYVEVKADDGQG